MSEGVMGASPHIVSKSSLPPSTVLQLWMVIIPGKKWGTRYLGPGSVRGSLRTPSARNRTAPARSLRLHRSFPWSTPNHYSWLCCSGGLRNSQPRQMQKSFPCSFRINFTRSIALLQPPAGVGSQEIARSARMFWTPISFADFRIFFISSSAVAW